MMEKEADLDPNIHVVYLPSENISISKLIYDEEEIVVKTVLTENSPNKKFKYHCTICGENFRFKNQLSNHSKKHSVRVKSHSKKHSGGKPYTCSVCKRPFAHKNNLDRHEKIHTGLKPHKCKFKDCNKRFFSRDELTTHHRFHTGCKPFKCRFCTRSFHTKSNQCVHERRHLGIRPCKCIECDKSFFTSSNLKRHVETVHSKEKGDDNQKVRRKRDSLQTKDHICPICGKDYTTKYILTQHLKVHTCKRSFLCSQCGHSFLREPDLKQHEQRHSGIKNFQCQWCQKSFVCISELITHKRIHSGERPFECGVCKKSFATNSSLCVHKRIHTGEKRFRCAVCDKAFTDSSTFKRHQRIHVGDNKPYSCQFCLRKFAKENTLLYHEKTRSCIKPYQCLHCGILIKNLESLKRHETTCDGNRNNEEFKGVKNISPRKRMKKTVQCLRCRIHFSIFRYKKHEKSCDGNPHNNKEACEMVHNNHPRKRKPFQCGKCGVYLKDHTSLPYHEKYGCLMLQEITDTQIIVEIGPEVTVSEDASDCNVSESRHEMDLVTEEIVLDISEHNLNPVPVCKANKTVISSPHHSEKEFSAANKLEGHSEIKPYKCSKCEKCFKQIIRLITHFTKMHSEDKLDQSRRVEELFGRDTNPSELEITDSEIHLVKKQLKNQFTNAKSLNCIHCGKGFSGPGNLARHSLIHSGIKPFKCNKCERSFNQKVNLNFHMDKVHGLNNLQLNESGELSQLEINDSELQHVRTRRKQIVNVPLLCCCHCGKGFSRSSHLTRHSMIHSGIKPFKCNKCEKSFNQKVNLNIHMNKLHSGNNYLKGSETSQNSAQVLELKLLN